MNGPDEPQRTCVICGYAAIPLDEFVVAEAVDYVFYFCGTRCYETWRAAAVAYLNLPLARDG